MEFIILASFMLLAILGFFAVTSSRMIEARQEGNMKIAEDIASFAYREIELAKLMSNGYSRVFALPQAVNGMNYSIRVIDNRELAVDYLGNEHIRFLPANVTGSLVKGNNRITKNNEIISLN